MNNYNYKVKLKFHLFWFIKNALVRLLIAFFQKKTPKRNGSEDSDEFVVYRESGNLDVVNNANTFSITICIWAVHGTHTEHERELRCCKVAELAIVVTVSVVLRDLLGVQEDVNIGGQDGRVDDDDAATYTPNTYQDVNDKQLSSFESF